MAGESVDQLKKSLLSILLDTPGIQRGQSLSDQEQVELERVIEQLQKANTIAQPNDSPILPGDYKLLCTFKPGANVSFTDFESWRRYLTGNGPSPVQALVTGNTRQVNGVYQTLDIDDMKRFENVVKFSDTSFLNITASIHDRPDDALIRFRFEEGNFVFTANPLNGEPFERPLIVPYPVPFKILSLFGDETLGSLRTMYLDEDIRISQGNKGSYFIFKRLESPPFPQSIFEGPKRSESSKTSQSSLLGSKISFSQDISRDSSLESPEDVTEKIKTGEVLERLPVIICPAQFAIPSDYEDFQESLLERGHQGVYTAAISRAGWLRILPSALTEDYWTGNLKPKKTLEFYYEAITKAYQQARKKHPESRINFIGHSIGGWILRSWLRDELSPEERKYVIASVVTLGTPHQPPPEDSIWKDFDQTRGLLRFVNEEAPGAFCEGAKYTCVIGNATRGEIAAPRDSDAIESTLAFVSYLPLCGNGNADGDGIVPLETGVIPGEGCEKVVINGARHSGFLPSPGPSIMLPEDWKWYGSKDCLDEWADKALV
eukprot:CAMPEP_0167752152 /NCGR_PEP_ID=MMETSP0110_2-20121227/6972_1 /TAXON_ID=629695 /ORGANISM="Gymnochlora sp., Strain CCMP2014" /LENGTH=545 /DNA_ID=CAMNT_0007637721 /DNA_START=236 /DNA_END=1873 /DNA_ORIENTATION=+